MKKIFLTGNKNIRNLKCIVKDILTTICSNYSIEEIDHHTISLSVNNNLIEEDYYVIANVDHNLNSIDKSIPIGRFITLGLNGKASVTLSSVQGDLNTGRTLVYCIQRAINNKHTWIEPQEFLVKIRLSWGEDIYNILSAVTAGLLIDTSISDKLN